MDIRNFFGGGRQRQPSNTPTAHQQLLDVQTRTQNLYSQVSTMEQEQIERAIDGIVGSAREMVRRRQAEQTPVIGNPGLSILQRLSQIREVQQAAQGPPPMRTEPQFVPVRPQAELRPRAPRPAQPVDWNVPKRSSRFKKLQIVTQDEVCIETECNVCFDSHTKDKILTTKCKHTYCITCWSRWMANNNSCPSCRTVCPPVYYYKAKATRRAQQPPTTA
jgi:hypothetical protein